MRSRENSDVAQKTYLYLRLGMVAVLVALAASVAVELVNSSGCWQRSVSAYYYTPVRAVFVGALVAISLAMVCLLGTTDWEDATLNLAGMCAPLVAFVPTTEANYCSIVTPAGTRVGEPSTAPGGERVADRAVSSAQAGIDNNVVAYLVAVGIALVFVVVLSRLTRFPTPRPVDRWTSPHRYAFYTALGLWLVVAICFVAFRDEFYDRAHTLSAVVLFVFIIVAVGENARDFGSERLAPASGDEDRWHRWWESLKSAADSGSYGLAYECIGVAMLMAGIGIPTVGWLTGWNHWVLAVEAALIGLFAAFWAVQTLELRGHGDRPEPETTPPRATPTGRR